MRIVFVTDTYEDGIAGGVVSAVRFVTALRHWHEVTVVATGLPAPGKIVITGIQVPVRVMRENRFTFGWASRARLEQIFAEADIVHVNFPFPLGLRAVRVARRVGVPVVAAFHVQPENVLQNVAVRSRLLSNWMYRWWVRDFFQLADGVVCPSAFAVDRLRSFGLTKPAWVVSNGVAPRLRSVGRGPARRSGPSLLLAVGRLAREKRLDVIIDAVARSRHRDRIRLVIAGAGPIEQALRERARRQRLLVEFGYVSEERLAELQRDARLFVHASEVELEGMAVLEAMAAGLPVLIADAPDSAARQFATGPEFLFRPGDADDLAAHIDRLLDAPALLAEGVRRSLDKAAQHDFHHSAHTLVQVYEAVIAAAGPRRDLAARRGALDRRGAA